MPFSFPSSPSIGDKSTKNSREYEWSGYAWEIVATPASLNASVITAGTLDAARLPLATTIAAGAVIVGTGLGVSSGTVSVTYGTTSGTACQGNDSRLSDTRTPTDGSVTTAKIANDAVTYAKIQNVSATDRLLGRSSAGSGDVEEITCTAFGRSLIDDADAATARTTLSVQPTASPAFTGVVQADVSNDLLDSRGNLRVFTTDTAAIDKGGSIGLGGKNGFGTFDPWAFGVIKGAKENATSGNFSGYLAFGTANAGGTITERLRINSSGQLLVTAGSGSSGSYRPGIAVSGDDDTGLQQVGGANTISLVTAGSERVRVDASGRVGIGVTPASAGSSALQVRGDVDIFGNGSDRSVTYNVGVGDDGITGWYRAKIAFVPSGAANNISQHISFWNKDGDNGGSTLTERMRIANDGKIYGYSVYATTVGATNRDLFIDSGGLIGYVSSIRASKTNIAAIEDVSWLRDLTPVSFHYRKRNEDGTYSDEADGTLDYGLIAEDVEPVAPEMCFYDVVDGEPQLRGVHYSKLITPMLRYIQQLEQRIAALEERLNHA